MRLRVPRDFEELLLGGMGGLGCILFVVAFSAYILFLSAAVRVLTRVEPENRRMDPGLVWLNLIPFFNLIWMVVTIERVGESIRNEFMARGRHKKSEVYGKTSGLACMVLWGIGLPFAIGGTSCALVFWFFAFIYWVVYWAQLSGYAKRLKSQGTAFAAPPDEGW